MGYGFRYVLGAVVLIAVMFAGLSLVPTVVGQWLSPSSNGAGQSATAPVQPADPLAGGTYTLPVPAPPQPPVQRNPGGASSPPRKPGPAVPGGGNTAAGSGQPGLSFGQPNPPAAPRGGSPLAGGSASPPPPVQWRKLGGQATQPPDDGQGGTVIGWRTARQSFILRKTPGGEGHHALTASLAPLTIVKGSHVLAIREEGGWMLVRSPGRTLGWVESRELEAL